MTRQNPETRWIRLYSRRFYIKHRITRRDKDRHEIYQRTIDIANHPRPNHIQGCITCPEGRDQKLRFNTGLVIVYRFTEPEIRFVTFYYDRT